MYFEYDDLVARVPLLFYANGMDVKFFNPFAETLVGANRLPHWDQAGATYFLTLRLADSLPAGLLARWRSERDAWLKWNPQPWSADQEAAYFKKFAGTLELWLDDGHGECLLGREDVRAAVEPVLTKFDGERYLHHAWVLMPNHAHLLFTMREDVRLAELQKAWKGTSSRATGLVLGRSMSEDAFWQKDYFDRLVRDTEHFWKCARYIRNNPLFAKLREGAFALYLSDNVKEALA